MPTTTIPGLWSSFRSANHGPWLVNGALYMLAITPSSGAGLGGFYKSTDGGATWTQVSNFGFYPTATGAVSGTTIHVAYVFATSIAYGRFDTTTDTFTAAIGQAPSAVGVTGQVQLAIAARSNGDAIILYQGATSSVMGTAYRRVLIARYSGTTWTSAIAITANDQVHYDAYAAVLGANDRVHLFYTGLSGSTRTLRHRTFTSANSLIAEQSVLTIQNSNYPVGLPYSDGTDVWIPAPSSGGTFFYAVAASADSPVWTATAVISGTNPAEVVNAPPGVSSKTGTTKRNLWLNDAQTQIISGSATASPLVSVTGPINAFSVGTDGTDLFVLYDNNGTITLDYPQGQVVPPENKPAAGSSTGTSTATAIATKAEHHIAAGSAAGTSTATANAIKGEGYKAVGASAGTSTASAAASARSTASGAVTGTSTAAGAASSRVSVSGSSPGSSTATAAASMSVPASGSAVSTSTATGVAGSRVTVSGTATGESTAEGSASSTATASGSSDGQATVSGAATSTEEILPVTIAAEGHTTGSSLATASASVSLTTAGEANGTAAATGSASMTVSPSGSVSGSSIATGIAGSTLSASGHSEGSSSVSGQAGLRLYALGLSEGTSSVSGYAGSGLSASGVSSGHSSVEAVASATAWVAGYIIGEAFVAGSASGWVPDTSYLAGIVWSILPDPLATSAVIAPETLGISTTIIEANIGLATTAGTDPVGATATPGGSPADIAITAGLEPAHGDIAAGVEPVAAVHAKPVTDEIFVAGIATSMYPEPVGIDTTIPAEQWATHLVSGQEDLRVAATNGEEALELSVVPGDTAFGINLSGYEETVNGELEPGQENVIAVLTVRESEAES